MAGISVDHINLAGVAATVPARIAYNSELLLSEHEKNILIRTTGIESRRIADPTTTAADLCIHSAKKLMSELNWKSDEVEIIVFVSQTPDHTIPGSSMFIQAKLGLSNQCIALDINQGCAGYVYGLSVISSMMQAGKLKKGLLLVGDTISKIIAKDDISLIPIFSDAGSCTALEYNNSGNMHFNLQTDGHGFEYIIVKSGGARDPGGKNDKLYMNGQNIFNFGLEEVAANATQLLSSVKRDIDKIDYFIMHQANLLLNESIRKILKVAPEKTLYSIRDYGNTSCASIPVSIAANAEKFSSEGNHHLLMSGFGVGLSWGSAIIECSGTKYLPIDEL